MIKSDPVAARQVKEYIKPQRLIEMLELETKDNRVTVALAIVKDLENRINNLSDQVTEVIADLEELK